MINYKAVGNEIKNIQYTKRYRDENMFVYVITDEQAIMYKLDGTPFGTMGSLAFYTRVRHFELRKF